MRKLLTIILCSLMLTLTGCTEEEVSETNTTNTYVDADLEDFPTKEEAWEIMEDLAGISADAKNDYRPLMYRVKTKYPDIERFEFYVTDEITDNVKVLTKRKKNAATAIVEVIVGCCLNDEGEGVILTTDDPYYDYISYESAKNVKPGDVVITWLVYDPKSNDIDDILYRLDGVVDWDSKTGKYSKVTLPKKSKKSKNKQEVYYEQETHEHKRKD